MSIAIRGCAALLGIVLVTQPARSQEAPPATTRITMSVTGTGSAQWPVYVALARGFFAKHGLDVSLVKASSAAANMQLLTIGTSDVAASGLVDPLRAIDKGAQISLLRLETQATPFVMLSKPALKTFADLRGKLISIGGARDITFIYLSRAMTAAGVPPGAYDMVYAGTTVARFSALVSGAVDAAMLLPPFDKKAVAQGFREMGRLKDAVGDMPFTGYSVNTAWASTHHPQVVAFLQSLAESIDWFNDDKNRAAAADIFAQVSKTDHAEVEQAYDFYRSLQMYDHQGAIGTQGLANLLEGLKSIGDIEGDTNPQRFIDPQMTKLVASVR